MFIRLEIHAKEYTDQSVATGKKSIENVDVVVVFDVNMYRKNFAILPIYSPFDLVL